jgi:hypothetical protein
LEKEYITNLKDRKALLFNIYVKRLPENVDELDTCSQSHQHFTCSFCTNIILQKNTKPNCKKKTAAKKTLLHKKAA